MESSSLDPEYIRRLKSRIQEEFLYFIKPNNVLTVFHKYNENILAKRDIEYVEAQKNMKGDIVGATKLLDRLCLYDGWFDCLINVLRDRDVRLDHVADFMENKKEKLDKKIQEEKEDLVEIVKTLQEALKMQTETIDELKSICNTRAAIIDNMESEIRKKDSIISELKEEQENLCIKIDELKFKIPNKDDSTNRATTCMRRLLEFYDPLSHHAQMGQEKKLKHLLDSGVDVNRPCLDETTAVMYAAKNGHLECVNLFINYKANLNMRDKFGDTAIAHAVLGRKDKCLAVLVEAGADVNLANADKCTPLMQAASCFNDCVKCLMILMESGADICRKDKDGDTAAFYAASYGNSACLKKLITFYGRKYVDTRNNRKRTPLMVACVSRNNSASCVQVLLDSGADIQTQDGEGKTALDLAAQKENLACVRILLRNGARFVSENENSTAIVNRV